MGPGRLSSGTWWIDIPIAVAALLAAWYTIWRRGLRPFMHAVRTISEEFTPKNRGASLREAVDTIGATLKRHVEDEEEHTVELRQLITEHVAEDRAAFTEIRGGLERIELTQRAANIDAGTGTVS